MEFLPSKPTLTLLARHGVCAEQEGDTVRFALDPAATEPPADEEVVCLHIGPEGALGAESRGVHRIPLPAERVGEAVEEIIHKLHATEWVIIPAGRWRGVLDLVAYTLAEDEDWQPVDAEAALHQNTHNPLGFALGERHIVGALIGALFQSELGPEQDLTIACIDAPLLIELRHDRTLRVWCLGEDLAETLAGVVR